MTGRRLNISGTASRTDSRTPGRTTATRARAGSVFPLVYAAAAGVVVYAGDSRALGWPNPYYLNPDFDRTDARDDSAGNVVVIEHEFGLTTYDHLESWCVTAGQLVGPGERIGVTGSTGRSRGKHLHFEFMPYPLNFGSVTYGRADPGPYFSTINPQSTEYDDVISPEQMYEIKRFIQDDGERRHTVTRNFVTAELSKKISDGDYSVKTFVQREINTNVDRAILDNRAVEEDKA